MNPLLLNNELLNNPELPPSIWALVQDRSIRKGKKSEFQIMVQEFKKEQIKGKTESKAPEVKSGWIYTL